ncbi:MAG: translesion error-prone DNA polymerase V autoproteolytic subunit [Desulfovibrio sp.]|nr:translesion error-prone DNA polymerase V autoproteolytic subunit [Desulfovibrio sp.]
MRHDMRHEFQKSEPRVQVEILGRAACADNAPLSLPLYSTPVEAGFPSPSEDDVETRLNLHAHLVKHAPSTFFLRVHGFAMSNSGIHDGDLLVVDRAAPAEHNRIVIVALDGELTVKRLARKKDKVLLMPENPDFPEIDITQREHSHIWGVVTYVIHML